MKNKEVEMDFATFVKVALSYNKPPPLCVEDLFGDEDWGTMGEDERKNFERIFDEVFAKMNNKQ